jgi:DNA-binding CsgD family transcriptional regulator/tetratricopeptide (TPR) repeat protein
VRQGSLVCPVTVGRTAELRQLTLELDAARMGRGRVTVIAGEAGVGKSRLAADLEPVARGLGMTVLHGRGVESEAPIPYRVIASAVLPAFRRVGPPDDDRLGPYRSALSLLVPEWADRARGRRPSSVNSTLAVLEATGKLLSVMAGGAGLLIVLEDLHWADAETLAVTNYLADTLSSERVLCLATVRPEERGPARDLVERAAHSPSASLVTVGRLVPTELDEMLRATLTTQDLPDGLSAFIATHSEGLPLAAEELLAELTSTEALVRQDGDWRYVAGRDHGAPEGFRRLVERRIARLSGDSRRMLEAAAMLGREFDWSLLPGVTGMSDGTVLGALGEAVDAQILSTVGSDARVHFRHALICASIVESLLPPERIRLARAAAVAIEAAPGAASAERLELAASLWQQAGDGASAARLLVELGRDALARSALSSAEATLERAAALAISVPNVRANALELLSDTLARAGKSDRCLAITEELMSALASIDSDASRLHTGWLRLARAAIADLPSHLSVPTSVDASHTETAIDALREADRVSSAPRDRAAVAALRALVAVEVDDYASGKALALEAIELSEHAGAAAPACEALYVLARVLRVGRAEAAIEPLQRGLALAERNSIEPWRLRLLLELGLVERAAGGDIAHLREARELARESGALLSVAIACVNLAFSSDGTWTHEDTMASLDEALDLSRRHRLPTLGMALRMHSMAVSFRGDRESFERDCEEIRQIEPHGVATFGYEGMGRFWWAMFNEDRAELLSHLDAAGALVDVPAASNAPTRGLFALISALVDRDGAAACDRVTRAGYGSAINEGLVGMARAIELARSGQVAEAERVRIAASSQLRSDELNSMATRFLAEAAIRDGWGTPAVWLRTALAYFDRAGMTQPARACAAMLRQLGEPVRRRGRGDADVPIELRELGVTSREMDVLLLVRDGLSNAEIAERLFMSPRTVETHVSHLFQKTGITNRGRLAARTSFR